jgi:dihydropteroate synthase type 2
MASEPGTEPTDPRLVGIVNITEDSYSDGGRYLSPDNALAHARRLHAEGADLIELGPAASNPSAKPVPPTEEQRRLAPVMAELTTDGVPFCVDSFHPETQRFARWHGAAYLNDIQGFPHREFYPELAEAACRLVVMHSVQRTGNATKVSTDSATVLRGIDRFFDQRLADLSTAGVDANRIVLDPGLGYFLGDTPEPSLAVLARISQLKARFGLPVLISPSRKSFLRALTGSDLEQIGAATLAAELHAAKQGADYIRTHDVAGLRDALAVAGAIERAGMVP